MILLFPPLLWFSVYLYMCTNKFVIFHRNDLIALKKNFERSYSFENGRSQRPGILSSITMEEELSQGELRQKDWQDLEWVGKINKILAVFYFSFLSPYLLFLKFPFAFLLILSLLILLDLQHKFCLWQLLSITLIRVKDFYLDVRKPPTISTKDSKGDVQLLKWTCTSGHCWNQWARWSLASLDTAPLCSNEISACLF